MHTALFVGKAALAIVPDLAHLYVECMSGWPYFITGERQEEKLRGVIEANIDSYFVITAHEDYKMVGACAAIRLPKTYTNFVEAFQQHGIDTEKALWVVQMTILPEYRGQKLSTTLVDLREAYARESGYTSIVFCSKVLAEDHPLRPADYVPLDAMWEGRGYRKVTRIEIAKTLGAYDLWVKELH